VRVRHSNRPGNLAIALRMSNDTAVQYCEVGKVGSSVNHLAVARLLLVKEAQELVLVLALTVDIPVWPPIPVLGRSSPIVPFEFA
jgi:stage V sporulation protein SpoVS